MSSVLHKETIVLRKTCKRLNTSKIIIETLFYKQRVARTVAKEYSAEQFSENFNLDHHLNEILKFMLMKIKE